MKKVYCKQVNIAIPIWARQWNCPICEAPNQTIDNNIDKTKCKSCKAKVKLIDYWICPLCQTKNNNFVCSCGYIGG